MAPKLENVFIIYPKAVKPIEHFHADEYIGIHPENVRKLFSSELKNHLTRLIALCPVTFAEAADFELHKILRAIGKTNSSPA
nr:hypothetical protein [Haliscomenobacter sp.]